MVLLVIMVIRQFTPLPVLVHLQPNLIGQQQMLSMLLLLVAVVELVELVVEALAVVEALVDLSQEQRLLEHTQYRQQSRLVLVVLGAVLMHQMVVMREELMEDHLSLDRH